MVAAALMPETVTGMLLSVFVPLPIGNGEHALNAHPVVGAGGALLIEDEAFTPAWIDSAVVPLVTSPERLEQMSQAASGIVRRDAAERLAELIHRAGEERR